MNLININFLSLILSFQSIRDWTAFIFLVIGGTIAIRTYVVNQRQKRLENSFRLLDLFKQSIEEDDIQNWIKLFHNAGRNPAGIKAGFYWNETNNNEEPLSELFGIAPPDNGATQRMVEFFDLLSEKALENTIDLKVIYYQLGQLMDKTYLWLSLIDKESEYNKLLENNYPHFAKLYRKYGSNFEKWGHKTYAQFC